MFAGSLDCERAPTVSDFADENIVAQVDEVHPLTVIYKTY